VSRPGEEWEGRSYRSLERPAEYFGCHISIGITAIIIVMGSMLSFMIAKYFTTAVLIVMACALVAGLLVKIGRMISAHDPFWPTALNRHFFDQDDYLDV
jgi:hypothetical protein